MKMYVIFYMIRNCWGCTIFYKIKMNNSLIFYKIIVKIFVNKRIINLYIEEQK